MDSSSLFGNGCDDGWVLAMCHDTGDGLWVLVMDDSVGDEPWRCGCGIPTDSYGCGMQACHRKAMTERADPNLLLCTASPFCCPTPIDPPNPAISGCHILLSHNYPRLNLELWPQKAACHISPSGPHTCLHTCPHTCLHRCTGS